MAEETEPMIQMTVRQRDMFLYRIRELTAENDMLKAKIARLELEAKP